MKGESISEKVENEFEQRAYAGLNDEQVNPLNMASIQPLVQGATTIEPSVKDIIALLQYLVILRVDSFILIN